jgi:hypothetical protein
VRACVILLDALAVFVAQAEIVLRAAWPCSAALRNQSSAFCSSRGTPWPLS